MMIPQKFLVMKCVRILFILHVAGILFVAYKIYSSSTSQPGTTNASAREYFARKSNGNASSSVGFSSNNNVIEVQYTATVAELGENNDEFINEEEDEGEVNTDTVSDDEDNTDAATENIEQPEQGKQNNIAFQSKNVNRKKDDTRAGSSVLSQQTSKSNGPNLAYKKEPLGLPLSSLGTPHWTIMYAGKYSKSLYSPPANERPIQRLPGAIVIGSPNSGIRPLVDFLEMHPQIVPLKKEITFFDNQDRLQFFSSDFLSQMPVTYSNQVTVVRARFSYWTRKSICDLYFRNKMLKVIVVLRDPVSRILSQVTNSNKGRAGQLVVAQQGQTLKINNDTETAEWGRYVEYLKMWTQCFPKSQIHIVEWSDIMQRPSLTVHIIEGFLGVPYKLKADNFFRDEARRVYCIRPLHTKSKTCLSDKRGKIPELTPQEEALIYNFYSKHNEELFKLLGQRYHWGP
ncbi:unnamed protein product [Candidula unifasciata]|uniref:Sulfotransferase domain-containing protein n=1 Tax=Candidula unifasciata TaxID=100452 RepID=A0A8S3ZJ42_9EUPU|nr:unnamed protein product [Candidula unifasciata]